MGAPVHSLTAKTQTSLEEVKRNTKRHRRHLLGNSISRYYFLFSILALCLVLGLVIVFIGKTALLLFTRISRRTSSSRSTGRRKRMPSAQPPSS